MTDWITKKQNKYITKKKPKYITKKQKEDIIDTAKEATEWITKKEYAGGGIAQRGLGRAFMKGGKV